MKKIIFLFIVVMVAVACCFAQPVDAATPDPIMDMSKYFASISAAASLCVVGTHWLKRISGASGTILQLLSWVVSICIASVGRLFNLGLFNGVEWWEVAAYGIGIGLIANGIFDIKIINAILDKIFPPKKV